MSLISNHNRMDKERMTRISVIGNAGGGKSALCRELSQALDIPLFPIDQIQWKPGCPMLPMAWLLLKMIVLY